MMIFPRPFRVIVCFALGVLLAIASPLSLLNSVVLAQDNLAPYNASIREMERDWQREYESYFGTNFDVETMDLGTMANVLKTSETMTGERTAIVWLMMKGDLLDITLLTPEQTAIHRTTLVDQDTLKATKKMFFRGITSQHPFFKTSYLEPAQELYDWIIRPIAATVDIENIDNLLFCNSKGLRTIPFGVLHDGEQFLIEKYGVGVIPAFQLMKQGNSQIGDRPILAMGASSFEELPDLPGVEIELETIVPNLHPGKAFLNDSFTLDNLNDERDADDYGIVHLATHAEFQSGTPDNSYIQFFDNRLSLDEMDELNWDNPSVELLVLSACRTALGDEDAELGFAGLALQSGVKAAIASLWYVSDAGSVTLMSEFYRALGQTQTKTKISALREAQLAMIHQDYAPINPELAQLTRSVFRRNPEDIDFSHPYYWAAYNLIGNPW